MKSALAVVLAGGEGERLSLLSAIRAKPAVPFGGKYRIIDFSLSNCINSGITDVMVLTQYNPRSLNDHIGLGRAWDLDRNSGGIRLMQPYIARGRALEWYRGTADAVLRNLTPIMESPADVGAAIAAIVDNPDPALAEQTGDAGRAWVARALRDPSRRSEQQPGGAQIRLR